MPHRALLGGVAVMKRHVAAAAQARPRFLESLKQELHQPGSDALVRLYALAAGVLERGVHFQIKKRGRREHKVCGEIFRRKIAAFEGLVTNSEVLLLLRGSMRAQRQRMARLERGVGVEGKVLFHTSSHGAEHSLTPASAEI